MMPSTGWIVSGTTLTTDCSLSTQASLAIRMT